MDTNPAAPQGLKTMARIVCKFIEELNSDPISTAYWFNFITKHISDENVINAIHPSKDVDGFHPVNVGRMVQGLSTFIDLLMELCYYLSITILKQLAKAIIIGRSNIVGAL